MLCIFYVLLIIVLPQLAKDISRDISQHGFVLHHLHPVVSLTFYSPGGTIKVSALYFVLKEIKINYSAYTINFQKMLFRVFVITFVVSIVVFTPFLIFTYSMLLVVVIWFIAMGIYKWESKNKKLILWTVFVFVMFITSSLPIKIYIGYAAHYNLDVIPLLAVIDTVLSTLEKRQRSSVVITLDSTTAMMGNAYTTMSVTVPVPGPVTTPEGLINNILFGCQITQIFISSFNNPLGHFCYGSSIITAVMIFIGGLPSGYFYL